MDDGPPGSRLDQPARIGQLQPDGPGSLFGGLDSSRHVRAAESAAQALFPVGSEEEALTARLGHLGHAVGPNARVLVEAQLLGGARGGAQQRRAERGVLAHQVPLALPEERLVERVVAAPGAGRDEAGELRAGVDPGVAQGVALEVEKARPGERFDLLPAHQGAVSFLAAQEACRVCAPALDVLPGGLFRAGARRDPPGDEEHHRLHAVTAQQGRGHAPDRAASVVEGEHHGALLRLALLAQDGDVLVGRQRDVAGLGEVRELARERVRLGAVEHEDGHVPAGQIAAGDEGRVAPPQQVAGHFPCLARAAAEAAQGHRPQPLLPESRSS